MIKGLGFFRAAFSGESLVDLLIKLVVLIYLSQVYVTRDASRTVS